MLNKIQAKMIKFSIKNKYLMSKIGLSKRWDGSTP